jgi:hypothetical protein
MSIAFPWLSNVIAQWSTGAKVCFCPGQRRSQWSRLRICDVFNRFEVATNVSVFDSILLCVQYTMQGMYNVSGRAANGQILPACNLKVFRMVSCDMSICHLSEMNIFRNENSAQSRGGFSGSVDDTQGVEY